MRGAKFVLKPKGGPKLILRLLEVSPPFRFTDVTFFPGARMIDVHEVEPTADGVNIKSRITVEGPLRWLWRMVVAKNVAKGVPAQTDALVAFIAQKAKSS